MNCFFPNIFHLLPGLRSQQAGDEWDVARFFGLELDVERHGIFAPMGLAKLFCSKKNIGWWMKLGQHFGGMLS